MSNIPDLPASETPEASGSMSAPVAQKKTAGLICLAIIFGCVVVAGLWGAVVAVQSDGRVFDISIPWIVVDEPYAEQQEQQAQDNTAILEAGEVGVGGAGCAAEALELALVEQALSDKTALLIAAEANRATLSAEQTRLQHRVEALEQENGQLKAELHVRETAQETAQKKVQENTQGKTQTKASVATSSQLKTESALHSTPKPKVRLFPMIVVGEKTVGRDQSLLVRIGTATVMIKVGESIMGWTLQSISPESALFVAGDTRWAVTL